ncbi:hypothetical protein [Pseudolysinimonas sp.]|jgi:hypothetical protein|uniref:hypothetical protein n=1 Tax=Pseudolysinimonas sp. TaxID=2680009 RepID=UPI0037846FF5
MSRRSSLLWAALGVAVLVVGFLPATRVPTLGDDFYVVFQAQGVSSGDLGTWLSLAWGWGMQAGHFNPIGQVLGGLYHFGAFAWGSLVGVTPTTYYLAGAFLILATAALAATYALTSALRHVGYASVPFWRLFALVAAVTGVTIQLHPWSNDPVTTYSMAGYASTAIGFLLIGFAFRAVATGHPTALDLVRIAVTAVFAVLFYEMLVAAVAATFVVYCAAWFTRSKTVGGRGGILAVIGVGVVLPAAVFIGGRLYVSLVSGTGGYTGTTAVPGLESARAFVFGMASSIPASAWPYTYYRIGQVDLSRAALVGSFALLLLLVIFLVAWTRRPLPRVPLSRRLLLPVGVLVAFWALATLSHTITPKYTVEISAPGLVYLFYAVGSLVVSLLLAGGVLALRLPAGRVVGIVLVVALASFAVVQQSVNWTLGTMMAGSYSVNARLLEASVDADMPESERCDRLEEWDERDWPDYYRDAALVYLADAYERAQGEAFCDLPDGE